MGWSVRFVVKLRSGMEISDLMPQFMQNHDRIFPETIEKGREIRRFIFFFLQQQLDYIPSVPVATWRASRTKGNSRLLHLTCRLLAHNSRLPILLLDLFAAPVVEIVRRHAPRKLKLPAYDNVYSVLVQAA